MKKVKIMLLSLALLAVVGGALAFKAKLGNRPFCTVTASTDSQKPEWGYYCAFGTKANGQTTTDLGSVVAAQTVTCTDFKDANSTTVSGAGNQLVCYTETQGATDAIDCQQLSCPVQVKTIAHD